MLYLYLICYEKASIILLTGRVKNIEMFKLFLLTYAFEAFINNFRNSETLGICFFISGETEKEIWRFILLLELKKKKAILASVLLWYTAKSILYVDRVLYTVIWVMELLRCLIKHIRYIERKKRTEI